jgi:hypothetical protein
MPVILVSFVVGVPSVSHGSDGGKDYYAASFLPMRASTACRSMSDDVIQILDTVR